MPVLFDASLAGIAARAAVGAVAAAAIALGAYRLRSLTESGAVAAFVIGTLGYACGGLLIGAALVLFFASASCLGRVRNAAADRARASAAKGARRDAWQVLANGSVAVCCGALATAALAFSWGDAPRWTVAALCALAAASGDTWSTEIGSLWGRTPKLATTMRLVAAGTSGGVTLAGALAAPLGGAVIAVAGFARPEIAASFRWLEFGALAGLAGSLVDSVLGATVQGIWRCSACGRQVEVPTHASCGAQAVLVRGVWWLDNDAVNLLATLAGSIVGYAATAA